MIIAALLTATVGIVPLTDSQRTRLDSADDHGRSHEEVAFYALIENVQTWDGALAGATVPDYQVITDDPDTHRGQAMLIDGTLEAVIKGLPLSRHDVGPIQRWSIVVNAASSDSDSNSDVPPGRVIVVYLTDPPQLPLRAASHGFLVPQDSGTRVRLAARFYKLIDEPSLGAGMLTYPAFVGKSVAEVIPATTPGNARPIVIMGLTIGSLALIYVLIRIVSRRRRPASRRGRLPTDTLQADDASHSSHTPLPEDPAAALDDLQRRHQEP
ncbi:MAG: hypothetical protein CMJ49_03620 [Planctomycetaceae bacterium]|nr:hypothetical protein [Planctomycetaceae bacterium]